MIALPSRPRFLCQRSTMSSLLLISYTMRSSQATRGGDNPSDPQARRPPGARLTRTGFAPI
jgi:hypothetical protein